MRRLRVLLPLLGACGGVAPAPPPGSHAPDLRVDCGDLLQRLDGFGSSTFGGFTCFERGGCDAEIPKGVTYRTTPAQRRAMIETAVRELGVSHLRLWLCPAGVELVNDNDDPRVIAWDRFTWEGKSREPAADTELGNRMNGLAEWGDLLRPAVDAGLEHWIVTAGWVPEWLGKRLKDPNDRDRFEEYAEWAAAQLLYLKKTFGLEAPWWSMMNEPDNQELVDPEFWKAWIRATGARFRAEGLRTRIMFPDGMNVYRMIPVVREVLRDGSVRPYIGALAYHHYRSCGDDPEPFLEIAGNPGLSDRGPGYEKLVGGARTMAEIGRHYGLPSWQTETAYYPRPVKEKGLSPWSVGRGRANEIHHELAAGASAVQAMLMIWVDAVDPRVGFTGRYCGHHIVMKTDGRNTTGWEVTKDCGAVMAHYARFTRPGDRVARATSADPLVRATAFLSRGGRRCVLVAVNNSDEERAARFGLEGLPFAPRAWGGVLTDETRSFATHPLRPAPGGGAAWETSLPPLSLTTFVWDAESTGRMTLPEGVAVR